MSERRTRIRRGEAQFGASSQDPESQKKERESLVKKVLFSRNLEASESTNSIRSFLSATKEELNETKRRGSQSNNGGSFISRSWKAASHSVRALSREECTICLDKYEKGDTVCWSKKDECDHIFHQDCITHWLQNHDECPLCRANLIEGVDVDLEVGEEKPLPVRRNESGGRNSDSIYDGESVDEEPRAARTDVGSVERYSNEENRAASANMESEERISNHENRAENTNVESEERSASGESRATNPNEGNNGANANQE